MIGAIDYRTRAKQHRPKDQTAIAGEIRRLAQTGLRPRDIASLLHVHPQIVTRVLSQAGEQI